MSFFRLIVFFPGGRYIFGQMAHLEVLSCRFFVFLSFFLGGINLVRLLIWRSSDAVFRLFVFFPGGY